MENKAITWFQINNWIPIVVSALAVAGVMANFDKRLSLVEEKVDRILSMQEQINQKYSSVEDRYGNMALRLNTLETLHNKR